MEKVLQPRWAVGVDYGSCDTHCALLLGQSFELPRLTNVFLAIEDPDKAGAPYVLLVAKLNERVRLSVPSQCPNMVPLLPYMR